MTAPENNIWAYLHGELSPEDAAAFELALQKNPALKKAFEEQKATHQALAVLSEDILSDEELDEQLLNEWVSEHPEYAEKHKTPRTGKILWFTAPLAAAAALAILLTLPAGPIHWQRTVYGAAPQLRNGETMASCYTRSELRQAVRKLQDAVEAACNPAEKQTLQIHIQELAEGALAVEVSCESRVWNENFQSLEKFTENIPIFGNQIANDL